MRRLRSSIALPLARSATREFLHTRRSAPPREAASLPACIPPASPRTICVARGSRRPRSSALPNTSARRGTIAPTTPRPTISSTRRSRPGTRTATRPIGAGGAPTSRSSLFLTLPTPTSRKSARPARRPNRWSRNSPTTSATTRRKPSCRRIIPILPRCAAIGPITTTISRRFKSSLPACLRSLMRMVYPKTPSSGFGATMAAVCRAASAGCTTRASKRRCWSAFRRSGANTPAAAAQSSFAQAASTKTW